MNKLNHRLCESYCVECNRRDDENCNNEGKREIVSVANCDVLQNNCGLSGFIHPVLGIISKSNKQKSTDRTEYISA